MNLTKQQLWTVFVHRFLLTAVILMTYSLIWQILEFVLGVQSTTPIIKGVLLLSFLPFIRFFVNRFIRFVKYRIEVDENGNETFHEMDLEEMDDE